jgi:hypothetical protein
MGRAMWMPSGSTERVRFLQMWNARSSRRPWMEMRATTSRDSHSKAPSCEKLDSLPWSLLAVVVGRRDSGGL